MLQRTFEVPAGEPMTRVLQKMRRIHEQGRYGECYVDLLVSGYTRTQTKEVIDEIAQTLPGCRMAGISILRFGEDEGSFLRMSFLFFEKAKVRVVQVRGVQEDIGEAVRVIRGAMDETEALAGAAVYPCGRSMELSRFLEGISEGRETIPFFGAMANARDPERELMTIADGTLSPEAVTVVLFFGGQLQVQAEYVLGWKPIGKEMEIALGEKGEVGETTLTTIDGVPAVAIYEKYLGITPGPNLVFNICEFPLYLERNGCPIARVPFQNTQDGRIYLNGDIREGERIRFSYGNRAEVLLAAQSGSENMKDFAPEAAFLFVCGNRTLFLKEAANRELDFYRWVHPELSYCHGMCEIYRQYGMGGVLNSALVAVGMREGGATNAPICRIPGKSTKRHTAELLPLEDRLSTFLEAMTQEYQDMAREADAANRAKSAFLSSMSHEIRTPINAVLGMDEMILRETEDAQIKSYAADIYSAGNTLLSLINDILDFSKIESGKMELVPVEYDLSSMVHDLGTMIGMRARQKQLTLKIEADPLLPAKLRGDDIRVRQILTNILTNAVKYTPEGTVWFRIGGQRDGSDEILHFEIEDTGIGIREENLPKLFASFERIDEVRNRSIEGTGLGMSITMSLLKSMGSRLSVESTYGKGSKFYFDLRQEIVDGTPVGDLTERIMQQAQEYTYTQSFCAPEAEVLVVDDNSMNRSVFRSLLKKTQIRVSEAESGEECLKLCGEKHYDLIFLDHMMPGMDGIETLHRLKADAGGENADTPVLILTANAVAGAKEMYLSEGFDGFLSKPVASEKLEKAIREKLPKELLIPVTEETAEAREDGMTAQGTVASKEGSPDRPQAGPPEGLPAVDGLDWSYAWLHLPEEELLEGALSDFYDLLTLQADKLEACYRKPGLSAEPDDPAVRGTNAPEAVQEACAAYRIQVHGMKSSAATVGIVPLAGMAQTLELAARDGETAAIRAMHGIFLAAWRSYEEKLRGIFGLGDRTEPEETKPPIDPAALKGYLELLTAAMDDLDIDTADGIIRQLFAYRYEEPLYAKLLSLKAAVADLDSDQAAEIVREIQGRHAAWQYAAEEHNQ